jgi:hypothetical protein
MGLGYAAQAAFLVPGALYCMSKHINILRCPLELFHQVECAAKAEKTMSRALSAIGQGDIGMAEKELEQACRECQRAKFWRAALVDMIITWGSTGLKLQKMGHGSLGADCLGVANGLSARFENGEFWSEG